MQAADPKDTYQRFWMISVDSVPTGAWWNSSMGTVAKKRSGDVMSGDISIADGDHKVYVAISQDGGAQFGSYAGTLQLDSMQGKFSGVDINTVKEFDITVKDGVVTAEKGTTAASGTMSFWDKAKQFVMDHKKEIAAASAGSLIIGGVVVWRGQKNGYGRF